MIIDGLNRSCVRMSSTLVGAHGRVEFRTWSCGLAEEESLEILACKKRGHWKSLGGRKGVARNPWVEEQESLEIPGWKNMSRSKSLGGRT